MALSPEKKKRRKMKVEGEEEEGASAASAAVAAASPPPQFPPLPLDPASVKRRLRQDAAFAAEVSALMYVPKHRTRDDEEEGEEEEELEAAREETANKTTRARTAQELQERLRAKMEEIRGKRGGDGSGFFLF